MASLSSSVVQPSTVYATDVHDGRSNELIMREGEQEPSPSDPSAWLAWVLTLPSLTDAHCAKVCDVLDEVSDGGIADMVTVENSEQLFVYGCTDLINHWDEMGAINRLDLFSAKIIEAHSAPIFERIDTIMEKGASYMYHEEYCEYWESLCEQLSLKVPALFKAFICETLLPRLHDADTDIRKNMVLMLADVIAADQSLIASCANEILKSVNDMDGWAEHEDGHKKRLMTKLMLIQDWLSTLLTSAMEVDYETDVTFRHMTKNEEGQQFFHFQSSNTNHTIVETINVMGERDYTVQEQSGAAE